MNLQSKHVLVTGTDGKISRGSEITKPDLRCAGCDLRNHGRNNRTGRLPRAVGVERTSDYDRKLKRTIKAGGNCAEVFHVGSDHEISIADLFKLIAQSMNSDAEIPIDSDRLRPIESEVLRLRCSYQKLREASGFRPVVSLRSGLEGTIDWFKNPDNLRRYKGSLYNV